MAFRIFTRRCYYYNHAAYTLPPCWKRWVKHAKKPDEPVKIYGEKFFVFIVIVRCSVYNLAECCCYFFAVGLAGSISFSFTFSSTKFSFWYVLFFALFLLFFHLLMWKRISESNPSCCKYVDILFLPLRRIKAIFITHSNNKTVYSMSIPMLWLLHTFF